MKRKVEADSSSWFSEMRICYFVAAPAFTPMHKVAAPKCRVQVQAGRWGGGTAVRSASLDQENKAEQYTSHPKQMSPIHLISQNNGP